MARPRKDAVIQGMHVNLEESERSVGASFYRIRFRDIPEGLESDKDVIESASNVLEYLLFRETSSEIFERVCNGISDVLRLAAEDVGRQLETLQESGLFKQPEPEGSKAK